MNEIINSSPIMTIALPSGRLFQSIINLFEESGYFGSISYNLKKDRHLVFYNENRDYRFIITKPKDNSTYVECGVADVGIVGKDILLEEKKDVYELLDLELGKCKIILAGSKSKEKFLNELKQYFPVKIATKYPNISNNYCRKKGLHGEIVPLCGSIELAPQIGLADFIVDLVSTGKTLKENNLNILDEITTISARLITNRISYKTKHKEIQHLIEALKKTIANKNNKCEDERS